MAVGEESTVEAIGKTEGVGGCVESVNAAVSDHSGSEIAVNGREDEAAHGEECIFVAVYREDNAANCEPVTVSGDLPITNSESGDEGRDGNRGDDHVAADEESADQIVVSA